MRPIRYWMLGIIAAIVWLGLSVEQMHAQSTPDLTWFSVDVGAAVSSEGGYTLRGVAGQSDAGELVANDYSLIGGVLAVVAPATPPDQPPSATLYMPRLSR